MAKRSKRKKPTVGRNPYNSKRERQVMSMLNKILPELTSVDNGFYSWLKSPNGSPMQLDRFYPTLDIAIEVDGRQHVEYSSYFHASYEAFEYQKLCDLRKNQICKERHIKLLRIKHDVPVTYEYLIRKLRRAGVTVPTWKGEE